MSSWKRKLTLVAVYCLTIFGLLTGVFWGSRAVTVMSQRTPLPRSFTLVIDPGHGGEDGGAISCTGRLESGLNLEISLRLQDLFHLLGWKTEMIRTTDTSVYTSGTTIAQRKISDLKQRVRMVSQQENPILISIHQNQFPDSRYSGAQVFYAPTPGSEALAKQLQSAFASSVNPGSRREAKKSSGIYLMEHISCPGILVECGFLSNPTEEAALSTPAYQKRLCCVIAATVTKSLSQ